MASPVTLTRIIGRLNIGGPAIQATLLAERLDPARYRTTLIAGTEDAGEGNYLALHGRSLPNLIHVAELGREVRGSQDLVALRKLIALLRSMKPQVVHTHTAKAGTLGRLAAFVCRVPVVVHTYHGHVLHGYFPPARTRLFVVIERALSRITDELVAVSPRVRDDLLALGVGRAERFSVVPLGLDLDPFVRAAARRGELKRELGLPPDTLVVGIVARLVPIKAHEIFLGAAREVAARRGDVRFLVVGDGERRAELERLAVAWGLERHVRFLGWRADLDRVYADSDVVALTSRNEGSPVALIEAMAAARAVVATGVGGVPDVVTDGETGCIVPRDDPSALAVALLKVLEDHEGRQRMGRLARARVVGCYGADRLIGDLDALYGRLLTAKGLV